MYLKFVFMHCIFKIIKNATATPSESILQISENNEDIITEQMKDDLNLEWTKNCLFETSIERKIKYNANKIEKICKKIQVSKSDKTLRKQMKTLIRKITAIYTHVYKRALFDDEGICDNPDKKKFLELYSTDKGNVVFIRFLRYVIRGSMKDDCRSRTYICIIICFSKYLYHQFLVKKDLCHKMPIETFEINRDSSYNSDDFEAMRLNMTEKLKDKERIKQFFRFDENEHYFKQRAKKAQFLFEEMIEKVLMLVKDKNYARIVIDQLDVGAFYFMCEGITNFYSNDYNWHNEIIDQFIGFVLRGNLFDRDNSRGG